MRLRTINIFFAFLGDSEKTKEISVTLKLSDGYSVITMPFNFSLYQSLSPEDKKLFWVKEITKVFNFVLSLMNCKSNKKISDFINYLNDKYKDE